MSHPYEYRVHFVHSESPNEPKQTFIDSHELIDKGEIEEFLKEQLEREGNFVQWVRVTFYVEKRNNV